MKILDVFIAVQIAEDDIKYGDEPISIKELSLEDLSEISQYLLEYCSEQYSKLFEEKK